MRKIRTEKYTHIVSALILLLAVFGCRERPEDTAEPPATETVIIPLARWQQEVEGEMWTLKFADLRIVQTINRATKKVTGRPPLLKGDITILNRSNQILDVKKVNVQFLDKSWSPIPFKDGEKRTSFFFRRWSDISPGEQRESSLSVNVPKAALKEGSTDIRKIRYEITYIPMPLKREALDISQDNGEQ